MQASTSQRIHYLDWLRIFAILSVFVGHIALVYSFDDWVIQSDEKLVSATLIDSSGHQIVLPLLFFISGAVASQRSRATFIRERFNRLLIPYLLFALLIAPLRADYDAIHLEFVLLSGSHLWFLAFLFTFSLIALPIFRLIDNRQFTGRLFRHPGSTLILALPIAFGQIILRLPFPDYLGWADFIFWFGFYVYGYFIFSDQRRIDALDRDGRIALVIGILAFAAVSFIGLWSFVGTVNMVSLETATSYFTDPIRSSLRSTPMYILVMTLLSLNAWTMVTFCLHIGKRFFNYTNQRLERLNEIALPVYIIHYPVIIIVGSYIIQLVVNPFLEMLVLAATAVALTFGIILFFIVPYSIPRRLLGMRQQSVIPHPQYMLAKQVMFLITVVLLGGLVINTVDTTTIATQEDAPPPGWQAIYPGGKTECIDGSPYKFFVRQAEEERKSDHLMIYFQTGGACWNVETCQTRRFVYDGTVDHREMSWYDGIFNFENPENPMVDYDFVFVSYCTADLHMGDSYYEYEDMIGIRRNLHHNGYNNARAVLDWTYEQYPSPDHVLLTGSSAGALASIYHAKEVFEFYDPTRVTHFGDGFVGVMPEGEWQGPVIWNAYKHLSPEMNAAVEESANSNIINTLYLETARQFPQQQFGQFSHGSDVFQITYYGFAGGDIARWPNRFHHNLDELESQLPNFNAYISSGFLHTTLAFDSFYNLETNGVRFRDWFTDYVNGAPVENVRCRRGQIDCP